MTTTTGERTRTASDPLPLGAWLLVGAGAALVGLLPWLVTGLRLPLQNLWASDTLPADMPRALLPFSQYAITDLIGLLVVGGALGGLVARAAGRRLPRHGVPLVAVGVLVVQVGAVLQTAAVVRRGLREGAASTLYLGALEAVAVLSVLVGVVALVLLARAPRGGAVVGLCVGALALGPWLSALLSPVGAAPPSAVTLALLTVVRWGPPVLVGAALGWGGVRTAGRLVAAGCGLALVWVVPALTTAIANATGSRALLRDPNEASAYAVEVFVAASTTPALVLPPLVVALVVALAVGLARVLRRGGGEQ